MQVNKLSLEINLELNSQLNSKSNLNLTKKEAWLGVPPSCRQLIEDQPIDTGRMPALPENILISSFFDFDHPHIADSFGIFKHHLIAFWRPGRIPDIGVEFGITGELFLFASGSRNDP